MNLKGIRQHLTYANVMATLAVFIVLGGGAYAATKIPKNSVGTKQLKKGAVTAAKVKNGSLLAKNFKSGQLPKGATGARGATGPAGANGAKGATGAMGATDAVVVAGGGEDAPALTGATHTQVLSTTYITIPVISNILVTGFMGSKQIECDPDGCEGTAPSDGTFVGLYLDTDPDGPTPTPIPEGGVDVTGGGLNSVQVPPMAGVIENVAPGNYKLQLIASSFNLDLTLFDGLGGGGPKVTGIATAAN